MRSGVAVFLGVSVWRGLAGGGEEVAEELEDIDPNQSSLAKDLGFIALGILGLAIGAYFLVENAVFIARQFNIPDLVIGITMVAIGTSLPELATSVVAAYRGASDISVGNVIGSNVFNVLLVLGTVSAITPVEVSEIAVREDLWVMIAISIIIWPLMRTGFSINRIEGFVLVLGYIVYTVYLFVR